MPRSIWKGVISFGMVSIPVRLFTATESKDVAFHQLHRECGSRLRQRRWCPVHDQEVERDEIVNGYEYAKEQYVVVTEEDLDRLPLSSKHTIQLAAFVDANEIDPVFHEKSYYLEPEETGVKPFVLLMQALKDKELAAVANVALRNKERLCTLRPMNGTLMLDTLFYRDEVRVEKGAKLPDVSVSEAELQMAHSFIELLAEPFQPEKYQDHYRMALLEVIQAKMQGEEVVAPAAAPPPKVTDLMAALKASVDAAKKRKEEEEPSKARRRRGRAA